MTTVQLIALDHLVALLSVAAWLATGVTVALRRTRLALGFLAAAVLMTLARVAMVAVLAGRGWWFVQEKVLLGLPLLVAAASVAALVVGPRLLAARWGPAEAVPAGSIVAPLTAAYAALAGLLVTFVVGYPLTWGTALIVIALVCAAALVTVRVVEVEPMDATESAAPVPQDVAVARPAFTRRRFVGLASAAAVVGAGSAGFGLSFRPAAAVTTGGGREPSHGSGATVSVADLRGTRTPAPGGVRRQYVLTARAATVRLPSGREIDAWTYDGQVPGPEIAATEGDLIEVRVRNADIEDGVTLHWHGYDVPCGEDGAPGVTQPVVAPGEEFVYRFRADQVGTYWYHTHQASHRGVRRGLYGPLVVTSRDAVPAGQLDLTLPVHTFDGVTVIGDQDGRAEHIAPPGIPVRLRLINTDSDPHVFTLAGTPFRVAAVDGRDLNRPGEVSAVRLRLPAGGRYDLVFVMPATPVALMLDNDADGGLRLRPGADAAGRGPAGRGAVADGTDSWPELDLLHYGTPSGSPLDATHADRHFTMVLDRGVAMVDGRPAYAHTVNGRGHPSIPDQLVTEGDLVRFTVVNRSFETHPWHLHGHPVLILARNGTPSSGSPLWMDTFDVRPGEVWDVAFEATNPGIWMNHCHNLPHAHEGMMLRLVYDGIATPFGDAHASKGVGTKASPRHGH